MNDLISRKQAIDELNSLHYIDREDWAFVLDVVEHLPSVEPQTEINMAYMRGKIDGINYCTERLRKMRMEADNEAD